MRDLNLAPIAPGTNFQDHTVQCGVQGVLSPIPVGDALTHEKMIVIFYDGDQLK